MDLKALMQKLETINTRQTLTESAEKEQTDKKKCPPMSHIKKMCQDGKSAAEICKMHPDCDHTELKQMVADCKETMSKDKKKTNESIVFKSSIARSLAEEFGYELEEATLTENPHANDPAKSAAWAALSPEDQKWLGGADPTDPYILARAPNKGKPATPAPGGAATKPAGAPELVGTQNQAPDAAAQADRIANRMDQEAGANTAGQAAAPAAPAAPAAVDPAVAATREKFKALLDKLEKTGGVSGSAPAAPTAPAIKYHGNRPKQPTTGAATKQSQPLPGVTGVPGAQISNTPAAESVTYEDDRVLLAIKNVRF